MKTFYPEFGGRGVPEFEIEYEDEQLKRRASRLKKGTPQKIHGPAFGEQDQAKATKMQNHPVKDEKIPDRGTKSRTEDENTSAPQSSEKHGVKKYMRQLVAKTAEMAKMLKRQVDLILDFLSKISGKQ